MGTPTLQEEVAALVPQPVVFRVAGEELRLAPLPVRRLLQVIQYVEKNYDLLEKAKTIGQPEAEGGQSISKFLEAEVYGRLNGLLRLLFGEAGNSKLLTDDWCAEHLSNAHYRAFIVTAMKQNQLDALFNQAKAFLGGHVAEALRQARAETPAEPAPSGS